MNRRSQLTTSTTPMKISPLVLSLVAFLAGAALFAAIGQLKPGDEADLSEQLSLAQAEIDDLKARLATRQETSKLSSLPSAIPPKVETVASGDEDSTLASTASDEGGGDGDEEEEQDPADAIANLLNSKEARGFMKQMSVGFSKRGEQWIEQGESEYTEKLGLSDEQVGRLKARLTAQMKDQTDAFTAKLDDENLSMQEIMEEQRDVMRGQEDVMAEILKEELDEDQFAEFEREQLVEKTQRVQRDSDRELTRLDSTLDLTESQEDQVFGILVQTNSDYDGSMQIEGAETIAVVGEDTVKEDAIRSVLDAEQTEKYNADLEQRQNQRRGPFGGGFRGFGR